MVLGLEGLRVKNIGLEEDEDEKEEEDEGKEEEIYIISWQNELAK